MILTLLALGCAVDNQPASAANHEAPAAASQRAMASPKLTDGEDQRLLPTAPLYALAFGEAIATSDLDGDGDDELIVGAEADSVWIYPSGLGGPVAGAESSLAPPAAAAGGCFGCTLSTAGDVNADGYGDLAVGAYSAGATLLSEGAAYVYLGSVGGLDSTSEVALAPADPVGGDGFGYALAPGDFDGDGDEDLLVGAFGHGHTAATEGAAYVFSGSSAGLDTSTSAELLPSDAPTRGGFGVALAAGDLDGDGLDEAVAGAPTFTSDEGAVYVYPGSASGPDTSGEVKLQASDGTVGDGFGWSVSAAGDLDGDGYGDLVVGAPSAEVGGVSTGAAYIYPGGAASITSTSEGKLASSAAATGERFGVSVASGFDVDEDGFDDLAVGAIGADGGAGVVCMMYGAASGSVGSELRLTASDAAADAYLGAVLAVGDLDGDGKLDIAAGAPFRSGSVAYDGAVYWWSTDPDDDGDGSPASVDCDDQDPTISPDATEACNDVDDDCDGDVDESGPLHAPDLDLDGYGDTSAAVDTCSPPAEYVEDATDCDDTTAAVHPGAAEADCADPVDYDCDGSAGGDDPDGDGAASCLDCAPQDASVFPGATEVCDAASTDEDCNGAADDADAGVTGTSTFYLDHDSDGWGDSASTTSACLVPAGYAAVGGDCDDTSATVHPGTAEVCDAADVDEDCDGLADDADSSLDLSTATLISYVDADGDGYAGTASVTCDAPAGSSSTATDCDDTSPTIHPAATEVCDANDLDEDCNGLADDADPDVASGTSVWYPDGDGDGFGDATGTAVTSCECPMGFVPIALDCDDTRADINVLAEERCDDADLDEDCDGLSDDADTILDPSSQGRWYADGDGDGYFGTPVDACSQPANTSAVADDCDDGDDDVHPGAQETCRGADDDDCDGLLDDADTDVADTTPWHKDADGDGVGSDVTTEMWSCAPPPGYAFGTDDCDDSDARRFPGATETCDGVDENCDSKVDNEAVDADTEGWEDDDGDLHGDPDYPGTYCADAPGWADNDADCDDGDASIYGGYTYVDEGGVHRPAGAAEVCDGIDQDCDDVVDEAAYPFGPSPCGDDGCGGGCAGAGIGLFALGGIAAALRARRGGPRSGL